MLACRLGRLLVAVELVLVADAYVHFSAAYSNAGMHDKRFAWELPANGADESAVKHCAREVVSRANLVGAREYN